MTSNNSRNLTRLRWMGVAIGAVVVMSAQSTRAQIPPVNGCSTYQTLDVCETDCTGGGPGSPDTVALGIWTMTCDGDSIGLRGLRPRVAP
jgi:hypothetical protein